MFEEEPTYRSLAGRPDAYPVVAVCLRWAIDTVNDEEAGPAAHSIADATVRRSKRLVIQTEDRCIWLGRCELLACRGGALFNAEEEADEIETRPYVHGGGTETTLDDCTPPPAHH